METFEDFNFRVLKRNIESHEANPQSNISSQEWRKNHPSARILRPPVLPIKQLLQPAVLSKCPVSHDSCCHSKEDITCHSLCGNVEPKPLVDLSGVVCACHYVEQETTRNLIATTTTRTSEVPQQDMAVEVCDLAENPKAKANLHLQITHRGVQRVVAVVSNVSSKGPVVGAVPKDV